MPVIGKRFKPPLPDHSIEEFAKLLAETCVDEIRPVLENWGYHHRNGTDFALLGDVLLAIVDSEFSRLLVGMNARTQLSMSVIRRRYMDESDVHTIAKDLKIDLDNVIRLQARGEWLLWCRWAAA